MKYLLSPLCLIVCCTFLNAQTPSALYENGNFSELVKLESKVETLTPAELYMVGYAFFQLENDEKAIVFYDKAIAKGFKDAAVHFYKGLSLRYLKRYDEAMKEVEIAIAKQPEDQEFMSGKGMIYYAQEKQDEALKAFEQAVKLPRTLPEPFYWRAHIYQEKGDFTKALDLYYETMDSLSTTSSYYVKTLSNIGQLEFVVTKNYTKSAEAYISALEQDSKNYILYPKLIKAYNAAHAYAKADSVFDLLRIAYEKNELPEEDMKYSSTPIDEYEWNGHRMTVYRFFKEPKNLLDISYKVYLLNKEGDKVERTFMVEQTLPMPGGPKNLLCEKGKEAGSHITYPYGWDTDKIPLEDLKKSVGMVLDEKMSPSASSKKRNK